MADARYDILGLGNAIVDIIALTSEEFIVEHRLNKGTMTLIAEEPAEALLAAMGATTVVSGGSAANTVIGAAQLGCTASFIGRVRNDTLGDRFRSDIQKAGVAFPVPHATDGPTTARCFILVTPDGHRTMNTYLGACQDLSEADIDAETVQGSRIVYLEGYLWDPPAAKAAFVKAAKIAHESERKVALSLSDPFCVDRYRADFLQLIRDKTVDILFANEAELTSLYEAADFGSALSKLRQEGILAAVTRSEKGCVILSDADPIIVPAAPITSLIDTTGAGDLFAAGFLTGLVRDLDLATSARLGTIAAAEIIQHIGARPKVDLRALAAADGIAL